MVFIVTNGKGIVGLVGGDYKFCLLMLCISRVGVTKACGFCLLQHVLVLIPRECLLWSLCIPLLELFEWAWGACCRNHFWDFVVCICSNNNYWGLFLFVENG